MITKKTATFTSEVAYSGSEDKKQFASVTMELDYVGKRISFKTKRGQDIFKFKSQPSDQWQKWQAVMLAVSNGIEHAKNEFQLNIAPEKKEKYNGTNT